MFWKTQKQAVDRLVEADRSDRARLEKLETERRAALESYNGLAARAESVAARLLGHARTAPPAGSDPAAQLHTIWEARRVELENQLENLVRERDQVLAAVNRQVYQAQRRITERNARLISPTSGWLATVIGLLQRAAEEAQSTSSVIRERLRRGWAWEAVRDGGGDALIAELEAFRREMESMYQAPAGEILEFASRAIERVESLPGFSGPICRIDALIEAALEAPDAEPM